MVKAGVKAGVKVGVNVDVKVGAKDGVDVDVKCLAGLSLPIGSPGAVCFEQFCNNSLVRIHAVANIGTPLTL